MISVISQSLIYTKMTTNITRYLQQKKKCEEDKSEKTKKKLLNHLHYHCTSWIHRCPLKRTLQIKLNEHLIN